jgi:hypothetical protein
MMITTIAPMPTAITSDSPWIRARTDEEEVVASIREDRATVFVDVFMSLIDDEIIVAPLGNASGIEVVVCVLSVESEVIVEDSISSELRTGGDFVELMELVTVFPVLSVEEIVGVWELEVEKKLVELDKVKLEPLLTSLVNCVVILVNVKVVEGRDIVVAVVFILVLEEELVVVCEETVEELMVVVATLGTKASSCPSVEFPIVVSNTIPSTMEGAPHDQYQTPAVPPVGSCRVQSTFPFSASNAQKLWLPSAVNTIVPVVDAPPPRPGPAMNFDQTIVPVDASIA